MTSLATRTTINVLAFHIKYLALIGTIVLICFIGLLNHRSLNYWECNMCLNIDI